MDFRFKVSIFLRKIHCSFMIPSSDLRNVFPHMLSGKSNSISFPIEREENSIMLEKTLLGNKKKHSNGIELSKLGRNSTLSLSLSSLYTCWLYRSHLISFYSPVVPSIAVSQLGIQILISPSIRGMSRLTPLLSWFLTKMEYSTLATCVWNCLLASGAI